MVCLSFRLSSVSNVPMSMTFMNHMRICVKQRSPNPARSTAHSPDVRRPSPDPNDRGWVYVEPAESLVVILSISPLTCAGHKRVHRVIHSPESLDRPTGFPHCVFPSRLRVIDKFSSTMDRAPQNAKEQSIIPPPANWRTGPQTNGLTITAHRGPSAGTDPRSHTTAPDARPSPSSTGDLPRHMWSTAGARPGLRHRALPVAALKPLGVLRAARRPPSRHRPAHPPPGRIIKSLARCLSPTYFYPSHPSSRLWSS
jgi:hypothetical protein